MRFMKADRFLATIEFMSFAVRSADMTAATDIRRPDKALKYRRYDRRPVTLKSRLSTLATEGLVGVTACAGAA